MADYSKLASTSVEWDDRELLTRLFQERVLQGFGDTRPPWLSVWEGVTVPTVNGVATLDFLIDASLMRPRYLIRLFETARRRAITLGRNRIEETDYLKALDELGWQVLEDFDRELFDVVGPPRRQDCGARVAATNARPLCPDLRRTSVRISDTDPLIRCGARNLAGSLPPAPAGGSRKLGQLPRGRK